MVVNTAANLRLALHRNKVIIKRFLWYYREIAKFSKPVNKKVLSTTYLFFSVSLFDFIN